tara:strand:+ start:119 stop:313 length:195 start_codon:yes stop_codon:yes gene_type:complete
MKKLPIFEDYIVDTKLKQFRKIINNHIEFIDFNSKKGEKLLNRYINSLDKDSLEFKLFIKEINF